MANHVAQHLFPSLVVDFSSFSNIRNGVEEVTDSLTNSNATTTSNSTREWDFLKILGLKRCLLLNFNVFLPLLRFYALQSASRLRSLMAGKVSKQILLCSLSSDLDSDVEG